MNTSSRQIQIFVPLKYFSYSYWLCESQNFFHNMPYLPSLKNSGNDPGVGLQNFECKNCKVNVLQIVTVPSEIECLYCASKDIEFDWILEPNSC